MKVRNILEEEVFRIIDEIAEEDEKSSAPHFLTSDQCRTDAACYVLNRLSPRYVSSGRGQAYADQEMIHNPQIQADLMALVHEGLRRVTSIQRSYYTTSGRDSMPENLFSYHFPVIKGRLLHGLTFEPAGNISIELRINGKKAAMIDANWENPYPIAEQTNGSYAFWPGPVSAEEDDKMKDFSVELRVNDTRFEPLQHSFTLQIAPRNTRKEDFFFGTDYRTPDMYLIPIA
ncbi:MAG: late competence development ComFB family protein [Spirochaeta sp.]